MKLHDFSKIGFYQYSLLFQLNVRSYLIHILEKSWVHFIFCMRIWIVFIVIKFGVWGQNWKNYTTVAFRTLISNFNFDVSHLRKLLFKWLFSVNAVRCDYGPMQIEWKQRFVAIIIPMKHWNYTVWIGLDSW